MRRRSGFLVAALAVFAFVLGGNIGEARDVSVGSAIESFSLPDTDGKTRSLDELKGKNGAVIVFLSAQCPVVEVYNERINQIAAEYASKGISFIGINSNSTESLDWIKSDAAEAGYKFPLLIDKGNVLADKLGATVTPEVYYIDNKNVLKYWGAIDNDRSGRAITDTYLKAAFDSVLGGKAVAKTRANAFGCSIKRVGE